MKSNVGSTDSAIRLILGIAIIMLGFYFKSWWGAVGLIPLITGSIKVCPLYSVLNLSSDKT